MEKSRAAKASNAPGEGNICKNMTVMGSNFPKKVRSTVKEWEEFDEQQRQTGDEYDRSRRAGNAGSAFEY